MNSWEGLVRANLFSLRTSFSTNRGGFAMTVTVRHHLKCGCIFVVVIQSYLISAEQSE